MSEELANTHNLIKEGKVQKFTRNIDTSFDEIISTIEKRGSVEFEDTLFNDLSFLKKVTLTDIQKSCERNAGWDEEDIRLFREKLEKFKLKLVKAQKFYKSEPQNFNFASQIRKLRDYQSVKGIKFDQNDKCKHTKNDDEQKCWPF